MEDKVLSWKMRRYQSILQQKALPSVILPRIAKELNCLPKLCFGKHQALPNKVHQGTWVVNIAVPVCPTPRLIGILGVVILP